MAGRSSFRAAPLAAAAIALAAPTGAKAQTSLPAAAAQSQRGQAPAAGSDTIALDVIVVRALKVFERAIDSLSSVSAVDRDGVTASEPRRLQDIFRGMPSVYFNTNVDDPGTGFNIRGLQDVGRVAVLMDGARQDFQVFEHGPNGKVYIEPELLGGAEVVRGPVANINGSGAIGGVVALHTRTADDILLPGTRYTGELNGIAGSNAGPFLGSMFFAGRPNDAYDFAFGGSYRHQGDYQDGDGNTVLNSGQDTGAGYGRIRLRPVDGHQIELVGSWLQSRFDSGAPGSGQYANTVNSGYGVVHYSFSRPDAPLFDFDATAYLSHTDETTVVTDPLITPCGPGCTMDFTGPAGTESRFSIDTTGFDIHNSSRFSTLGFDHTVTLGVDYFRDDVSSSSTQATPDAGFHLTPSGERQVYGGFAQWKLDYRQWLDVIGALRYDAFDMHGGGNASDGSHLSPKITVGLTPLKGFTVYGTYAEGYRAPSVTEAFVSGFHPGMIFRFLPNPNLKPEVGRTMEVGVNLRYGDLLRSGDAFRLKADVFRNNVDDFIDLVPVIMGPGSGCFVGAFGPECYQFQNIAHARIQGVELEASYDAGPWFVSLSGQHLDGKNVDTGVRLTTVAPDQVSAAVGVRLFDRKLTIAPNYQHVWHVNDPSSGTSSKAYDLLGLRIAYKPNDRIEAALSIDNMLNQQYTPYLQNLPAPGISVMASIRTRFGAK
ncbi:MAG TPA: TonB-dependent hemoglobin/transferrin/lactoferrin family receptor [Hyphomicrobiales bacterium]|nr:TonB-dependent hemoglobin/transferrin/lactoferrin family receptor [Hyphomicrobiales bacterium]